MDRRNLPSWVRAAFLVLGVDLKPYRLQGTHQNAGHPLCNEGMSSRGGQQWKGHRSLATTKGWYTLKLRADRWRCLYLKRGIQRAGFLGLRNFSLYITSLRPRGSM